MRVRARAFARAHTEQCVCEGEKSAHGIMKQTKRLHSRAEMRATLNERDETETVVERC